MRILVTGASGFVGAALVPRLVAAGHDVRVLTRDPVRVDAAGIAGAEVCVGDAVTGDGVSPALKDVDCAYYLIHSMEPIADGAGFAERDRTAAQTFRRIARRRRLGRLVYLGGLVPAGAPPSPHLASRLEVERLLLGAAPDAVALRASIVIGARSRSFRLIVRLLERLPVIPLPAWRDHRTTPIDIRDLVAFLVAAAHTEHAAGGLSLDIGGPDIVTYAELIESIRTAMLVRRPALRLRFAATPIASAVVAAVTGEPTELVGPLMMSLQTDLLPRDDRAARLLGAPRHRLAAAIERALRDWEHGEDLRAR